MARPRSDEKRTALLCAAIKVFAERGLTAAPTSAIAQEAQVAEGTLFTYFPTKNDLVNALYREARRALAEAMLDGFPAEGSLHDRLAHAWDGYLRWSAAHPQARLVMRQLDSSGLLTEETRAFGVEVMGPVKMIDPELVQSSRVPGMSFELVHALMSALGDTILALLHNRTTEEAAVLRRESFGMIWRAISP